MDDSCSEDAELSKSMKFENPVNQTRNGKPASVSTISDIQQPISSSTPTNPVNEASQQSSTGGKCSPTTANKLPGSDAKSPRSHDLDAMSHLLMDSQPPQPVSLTLSEEVAVDNNTPTRENFIRQEDIEAHKVSHFRPHHPLQSAHKKRRSSAPKPGATSASKISEKTKRKGPKLSHGSQPQGDLPDGSVWEANPVAVGYIRSQSVPATSVGDTQKSVQFAKDNDEDNDIELQKLKPISEENVKIDFQLGDDTGITSGSDDLCMTPSRSRKSSRLYQGGPHSDSLSKRQVPGDKVQPISSSLQSDMNVLLQEEDRNLSKVDKDQLISHRFDYYRHVPRISARQQSSSFHSTTAATSGPGVSFVDEPDQIRRIPVDHTAHDVFVELDELVMGEEDEEGEREFQWKERARWIKYEEDVELGGEWGKPHVSTLSFHSLLELRRLLEHGVSLFDLEERSLDGIVGSICQVLRERGALGESESRQMEKVLRGKHSHQGTMRRTISAIGFHHTPTLVKKHSSATFNAPDGDRKASANGINGSVKPQPDVEYRRTQSCSPLRAGGDSCSVDLTEDKATDGQAVVPNVSFLLANPARKQSVFSNLMALGGSYHNGGSVPQLTDIEKRLPEGAEVANVWVGSVSFLQSPIMVFVRLAHGVVISDVSEVRMPMRFIFILMGPVTRHMVIEDYHEIGRAMSTLMSYKDFREACYVANDPKDLVTPMNAFLDGSVVVPAHGWNKGNVVQMLEDIKTKMIDVDRQRKRKKQRGERRDSKTLKRGEEEDESNELRRSGRCLGGLIRDVKRRYPLYRSDITDALNFQCFSVIIFIFFAALTPSITFGADVEMERVNSWMGVYETILGSAITGAAFGLLSGQPLLIIGCTGPLAVFEGSLYEVAESVSEVNYMPFRCWVGLWLLLICVLTAVFELSFVLKYFTRFTEEIFAMLVSLIFCVSVIRNLIQIFKDHPLGMPDDCQVEFYYNSTYVDQCIVETADAKCGNDSLLNQFSQDSEYCCNEPGMSVLSPNTALLSLILTSGCFIIAYFLKQFRSSPFLSTHVRKALGDFGVPIAILVMTGLDLWLNDKIYTKKLNFPDKFEPTKNADGSNFTRNWLISPFELEKEYWWMALVAAVPAVLVFFLIFIEIQITARILDKKEHNLQKGTGYHLNILMIGLSGIVCGVLGCPFVTGATVRSVSHTSALIVTDPHHAPGERAKMSVIEQRVTSVMVNVFLGLSVLLKSVLKHVPYSVLYGVFFYMGIACLGSLQFYDRIKLMFMQRKNYPSVPYVRNVSGLKVHLFTIIQIFVLAILWAVKESPISILFPFFLIMLVPVRLKLLPKIYTEVELAALDSEEVDVAVEQDDADYNLTAHMPY
ncbi:band 3 anion transport protein-like isoform X2 [Convolutriloba macropyga]|uniref:band 3 anion transport protein-like isoform X2 n=1 Tax=Convolutriloba macropyga TaxID=536237 RepID=UPI003F525F85